jgi:hypothetical protein
MSIFQKVHTNPTWKYEAENQIWRLFPTPLGFIIGEIRNPVEKNASFFCVNGNSGTPQWRNFTLDEKWWVGIETIIDNVILFHKFAKPDLPEHKSIIAISVWNGSILWKNEEVSFWFIHQGKIYAYQEINNDRIGFALDVGTGEIIEQFPNAIESLMPLRKQLSGMAEETNIIHPYIYDESVVDEHENYIIKKEIGKQKTIGEIELLEWKNSLIINYYIKSKSTSDQSPMLENHFAIYDTELLKKKYSDILLKNTKIPMMDTFFSQNGFVYFIKNLNILCAVKL